MIKTHLEKSLAKAKLDLVPKFYIAINIENAIFKDPENNSYYAYPIDPHPNAIETLNNLSKRDDIGLIFTSNLDNWHLSKIFHFLKNNGILKYKFQENSEVNAIGNKYYGKGNFYYSYLLDERSGFNPSTEWKDINDFFNKSYYTNPDTNYFIHKFINQKVDDMYYYFDCKEQNLDIYTEIYFKVTEMKLQKKNFIETNPRYKVSTERFLRNLGLKDII